MFGRITKKTNKQRKQQKKVINNENVNNLNANIFFLGGRPSSFTAVSLAVSLAVSEGKKKGSSFKTTPKLNNEK